MVAPGTFAKAIVAELHAAGIVECCVAAGARNAELLIALAETPEIRLTRFFDERSAGFFALGRIKATEKPVAVVTTSGTAVAELLPAVVEAHYQGLPLGVISADRPRRFEGSGAPQAILQPGIFSGYVAAEGDVSCAKSVQGFSETISRSAPWHLNVRFEEPGKPSQESGGGFSRQGMRPKSRAGNVGEGKLVVMIGDLLPSEREEVATYVESLQAPVWAEAASGLRERCTTLRAGDSALRAGNFKHVLRIGGVPSCRFWRDLESLPEIAITSVCRTGYSGLARESTLLDQLPKLAGGGAETLPSPSEALLEKYPLSEPALVRWLSTLPSEGSAIFLGNSMPIREWNSFATWEDRRLRPAANRGANGIDGLLSTFFGIAANEPESWILLGDLSALYDLNAPWVVDQLPSKKRRIVVINNSGGRIFDRLPALAPAPAIITNPHQHRFRAFAEMWGWHYVQTAAPELPADLPDHAIIEVLPNTEQTEAFWEACRIS